MEKSLSRENSLQARDTSLDLIRIAAFMSVISVHFFLNNGFYGQVVLGKRMYVMMVIRTFFIDCVPLFLVLSGYLMHRARLSRRYYAGLVKTVLIYVFSSLACMLYASMRGTPISLRDGVFKLLNFSGAPYSWYIEMYLGLFLLIPFLNLAYNGLTGKRQKQLLVLSLLLMTALPGVVNVERHILPAWWTELYPVSYYMIGAYLSEYMPKLRKRTLVLLLAVHLLANGSYNYYKNYSGVFQWGSWCSWGSLLTVITTVLVFMILKKIRTDTWSLGVKSFLKYLSGLCLGAYLVSWIFDDLYYPVLARWVPEVIFRLEYMAVIVPAVIVSALLLSAVVTPLSSRAADGVKKRIS